MVIYCPLFKKKKKKKVYHLINQNHCQFKFQSLKVVTEAVSYEIICILYYIGWLNGKYNYEKFELVKNAKVHSEKKKKPTGCSIFS